MKMNLDTTEAQLRAAGCVAADEEAAELHAIAGSNEQTLRELVARRCSGEPLAWLVGFVRFCDEIVLVHPGIYVPRWQSEILAMEAVVRLPERGVAVDLCTGSGAIALVMARRRPNARVVATEIDPRAADCARENGLEVYEGDMAANLPRPLFGTVDVVTAVVPYVPTGELRNLPRDVIEREPMRALHGGKYGTEFLALAIDEATSLLRPGGSLLLELGGDQAPLVQSWMVDRGYRLIEHLVDDDGDPRGIVGVL